MAAITDFANPAAAVSAGYIKTQVDRGAGAGLSPPLRYLTRFSKPVTGATGTGGDSGFLFTVEGESSASAAAADTQATAALNAVRRARYGGSPGRASGDSDSGHSRGTATHVADTT